MLIYGINPYPTFGINIHIYFCFIFLEHASKDMSFLNCTCLACPSILMSQGRCSTRTVCGKWWFFHTIKIATKVLNLTFRKIIFDSYPWYIINACISKSNYLMSLSLLRLLGYLMQLSSSFVVRCGLCVKILHHGSWVYTRVWSQYGL